MPKKKRKRKTQPKMFPFLGGNSTISFLDNRKALPRRIDLGLNYKQAKKRYNLMPWGDRDLDGTPNIFDCKPFDASRDGILQILKGAFKRRGEEETISELPEKLQKKVRAKLKRKEAFEAKRKGEQRAERRRLLAKQEEFVSEAQKGFASKLISGLPEFREEEKARRKEKIKKRLKALVSGPPTPRPIRRLLIKKVPVKTKTGKIVFREKIRKLERPAKVVRGVTTLVGVPAKFPKVKDKKEPSVHRGRGRPRQSYKYSIPSKGPVPVHIYKKWLTRQRALARLRAEVSPEQLAAQQLAAQQIPTEEFEEEAAEEIQTEELEEVPTARPTPQPARLPVQIQRQVVGAPVSDNILHAPNIARGELRNAGGFPSVRLGERPVTNPQGEVFTQIDPATGKPILQRRINEKFATGELL